MAEYIERKRTVELLRSLGNREYRKEKGTIQDAIKMISYPEYTPTEDVAPVVHGRWKLLRKGDWTSVFVCSVCGRREKIAESESYNSQLKMPREYPYCHCGARMDGDSNDLEAMKDG